MFIVIIKAKILRIRNLGYFRIDFEGMLYFEKL